MKQTRRSPRIAAVPSFRSRVVRGDPDKVVLPRMIIPGEAGALAEEEAAEGVEGRPADPKTAPWGLRAEIVVAVGVLVLFGGAVSVWLGWQAGLASLGIGLLGMVFNPLTMATILRARDREVVLEHHVRMESDESERHPMERSRSDEGAGPAD